MTTRTVRETAAIAAIGLALCLMMYHQVKLLAPLQEHSAYTFAHLARQPRPPPERSDVHVLDLQKRWAPRILSNILAALITEDCLQGKSLDLERFSHKAGLYASVWLGMVFSLYLLILRNLSLIPILGTFCGVAFGYTPGIADRIFPWDMPALFFYSLFICFLIVGRIKWFLLFLPLAVLFKETSCVLVLAYLFVNEPKRKRLLWFALALILGGGTKTVADLVTQSTGGFSLDPTVFWANVQFILFGNFPHREWYTYFARINHPLFINAGLLAAFWLYPFKCRHKSMLRVIVLLFVVMALFWAVVFEYRIWFELIPLSLYPFYCGRISTEPIAKRV